MDWGICFFGQGLFNHFSGGAGADEVMFCKLICIVIDPFGKIGFPVIVCHKSNGLYFIHQAKVFTKIRPLSEFF